MSDMEPPDEISATDKDIPLVNNLTHSSEVSDNRDPEQELRELEARVAELRKHLQDKSQQATKSDPKLDRAKNDRHPKVQKILKDVNLFDQCAQINKSANVSKGEPEHALDRNLVIHTGDTDSSGDEANRNPMQYTYNEFGQFIKKRIAHKPESYETKNDKKPLWRKKHTELKSASVPKQDDKLNNRITTANQEKFETEAYSGIRIINPLVSFGEMQERMNGRKMVRMSTIRMHMRGGDIEGDWVTIGVLVNKSEPKKSAKGNAFSVWKLCDLKDCNKIVALFLFGKSHEMHWKTVVGSVIGILNPSFMPDRDSMQTKGNGSELCITVDNPQKILLMGTSKDFGLCRGKRKDGNSCTMLVNRADCEFCQYHVQKEYRKSCAKRMDLQASYSGPEPSGLRTKILQKQQVMYGGQIYMSSRPQKKNGTMKLKDRLTLDSLKLQKKANEIANAEQDAIAARLASKEKEVVNNLSDHSESLAKMLTVPSAGSRNLLKHMTKHACTETGPSNANSSQDVQIKSITAKELLKLQEIEINSKRACGQIKDVRGQASTTMVKEFPEDYLNCVPKLARGLKPGESIDLQFGIKTSTASRAKAKAVYLVQAKGMLQKANPNAIMKNRSSPEFQEKIKKRLAEDLNDSEKSTMIDKKARLQVDVTSETFQKLLNKKSKYENLVDEESLKLEEKYFNELEKKENLENKMISTMEVPCKAVSCKNCKYSALAALESCRTNGHPLVFHKAIKRFFQCKDCRRRTISLNRLPTKPCSGCGGKNYEKVAMWKEKSGPKVGGENLLIRGDEIKQLNSLTHGNVSLNL